ncbi:MAG: carbohydrate ABC transporter permease [Bacteroidota bacterium]|jgi:multiple sugar transport system permease protein|nr:sugar ABC transporter permease [Ignavibacteria bacterium]MCU7500979.1 sugar ABC transporter permease [Ignavibacteria bacterium]MCU7514243.1 sugar ABC transporter permease [Ignavibacteria bacterium]MCU7521566.1 sugar ABC transporter permease [Ignavibacteria bacterium]MCU7525021.1 sugar ABC transporter permease [Ignavibacteria bacterium]
MKKEKKIVPYLMIAPYVLHFLIFVSFPVVFSFILMFNQWNIISPMKFVGLQNFYKLFQDAQFFRAILNTLVFLVIHIPLQIITALFFAVLLNQKVRFIGFFRAAYFLPVIVSGVVVTILWQQLYAFESGLFNRLLSSIGLSKVGWLVNPNVAMPSIAIMATWKNVGLYIVLFLVGLQTVPPQLYEAAELEGAGAWQKFRYVTFPMINPTVFLVLVLSTIGGFSLFIEPYVMTDGGPLNATLSAVLYIYRQGFYYYHMGYAAALGFFFAAIILLVIVLQRRYIEKETG